MPMPIMAHAAWWSTNATKQQQTPRRPTEAAVSDSSTCYPPSHTSSSTTTSTFNNKTTSSTTPIPIPAKYADGKLGSSVTVTTTAVSASTTSESDSDNASPTNSHQHHHHHHHNNIMSKGRAERRCSSTTTTAATTTKTPLDTSSRQNKSSSTPISSPVQIPRQSSRTGTNRDKHYASQRRRTAKDVHSPDAVSPSVAALLAMTDIPRHRPSLRVKPRGSSRTAVAAEKPLTVEDIVQNQHVSEKEFSLSLSGGGGGSPLEVLLSPPDDMATEDEMSTCESPDGSSLRHTVSFDSVPSLAGDSYITDAVSSFDSSSYFSGPARRTRSPARKSLEPVRSLPDVLSDEHPLSINLDDDDDYPAMLETIEEPTMSSFSEPFKPLRAVFKSNLTASLRALRSAAKSFSSINFPSLPPDDLLSRSILTIDPNVPYTDERRPPVTEEMPSAELRRYLNPTTRSLEVQPQDGPQRPRLASIQMQTYKVHRSQVLPTPAAMPSALPPAASSGTTTTCTTTTTTVANVGGGPTQKTDQHSQQQQQQQPMMPAMRQREIRENPDFIRIAVMEMAMRKRGKLDDRKPGRARWALPPRKAPIKSDDTADEIGPNGVPLRWIPITYE